MGIDRAESEGCLLTESQEDGVRKKLENQKFSFEGEIMGRIVAIGGGNLSSTEYLNKYAISIARE